MNENCIGCGLCEAMCHKKAIAVQDNETGNYCKIDKKLCNNCGICTRVCPFEKIKEAEDFSSVKNVSIGKSKNNKVVEVSASGGIVSEILIFLFENNLIDAALVAYYDNHANIFGDIIEKAEDVLSHSGSFYHTSKQLINVKKISQYDKVAVVGLPCHIEGVLNFCKLTNQVEKVITISLFCTIGRTYEGFRRFFKKETGFDVSKGYVSHYLSRLGDHKMIHIENQEGNDYECLDEKYKFTMDFFWTNKACYNCRKMYGLSADISVGDAWHKAVEETGIKKKIAIVSANSSYGHDLIKLLSERLELKQAEAGVYDLICSQRYGAGLKIRHNRRVIYKLNKLTRYRKLILNPFLFRFLCRYRGRLLRQLETETEEIKKDYLKIYDK